MQDRKVWTGPRVWRRYGLSVVMAQWPNWSPRRETKDTQVTAPAICKPPAHTSQRTGSLRHMGHPEDPRLSHP